MDQAGGGVQQAVALPFRLSRGEVTGQGVDLQPRDQVRGDRGGDASDDGLQRGREDRIRCAEDTGLRRLPSREFAINQARKRS